MAKVSDLQKALKKRPSDAALRDAVRSVNSVGEATRGIGSSILAQVAKSVNETTKGLTQIGGKSGFAEAIASANSARHIMDQLDVGREAVRMPQMSVEAMRWQAEKEAAPVATRDAVLVLADGVDSLAQSQRRSDRILIWLTVGIFALTAMLLGLTAVLVLKDFL
jgi:hypothetical protein